MVNIEKVLYVIMDNCFNFITDSGKSKNIENAQMFDCYEKAEEEIKFLDNSQKHKVVRIKKILMVDKIITGEDDVY